MEDSVKNMEDARGMTQCKLCGEELRFKCSTEVCLRRGGFVCIECHSKDHDITECYGKLLPQGVLQLLPDYTSGEISGDSLARFWQQCTQFLVPDKDFDLAAFRAVEQMKLSSYILAVDFLLKGKDHEAVLMMFFAGLLREIDACGPDFIRNIQRKEEERNLSDWSLFSTFFDLFHSSHMYTSSPAHIANRIEKGVAELEDVCMGKGRLKEMLEKVVRWKYKIHDLPQLSVDSFRSEIKAVYGDSRTMLISMVNLDTNIKDRWRVYKDASLSWWLKLYVIKCNRDFASPRGITPSTRYFRIVHNERTIFLSSSGKKTLQDLGIKDGDVITVGGVDSAKRAGLSDLTNAKASQNDGHKRNKPKKKTNGRKKKKGPKSAPFALTEEEIIEKQRESHSIAMTRVFEEMSPKLKDIRNRLNDLAIYKLAPKVRKPSSRAKHLLQEEVLLAPMDTLGGKAGKVAYPILVGDVSYLYNTSKLSARCTTSVLDLHGYSKEEALAKLKESLPVWIDTAMRGECPWVIPVDIVCGGGSQVLSDFVRDWIRNTRQVANRPKNFS